MLFSLCFRVVAIIGVNVAEEVSKPEPVYSEEEEGGLSEDHNDRTGILI